MLAQGVGGKVCSRGAAGVASVRRSQGLPHAAHSQFQMAPLQTHPSHAHAFVKTYLRKGRKQWTK